MSYHRPPPGHPLRQMYDETQIRILEQDAQASSFIPTMPQAIELARQDLAKEPRALSFQYLALTSDGRLVLMQIGRHEQRVVWSFGKNVPTTGPRLVTQAYDEPDQ